MKDAMPVHAVVTGGASGIGRATSEAFVRQGARVTVLDLGENAEAASVQIGADFIRADVSNAEAIEAIADQLEHDLPPTVLVTCAGVLQRMMTPEDLSWGEWDRTMAVHQRGTFACCKSFGARMTARGSGSIVTIASVAGIGTGPLHAYGPAKAAIAHMTKGLAAEWGPKGLRVNCVAPGFTATPALERGMSAGVLSEDLMCNGVALGRLVRPEEIAEAILFLSSPAASAITGVVLPVDAGYLVTGDWAIYGGLR